MLEFRNTRLDGWKNGPSMAESPTWHGGMVVEGWFHSCLCSFGGLLGEADLVC